MASLDPSPKYSHAPTPEESTEGGENSRLPTPAREEPYGGFHGPAYEALSGQAAENGGGLSRGPRTDHHSMT
jgi:hypothetical protein